MEKIQLKVVTQDKLFFDGYVDNVIVRTTEGDVGIMKNHVNYLAALNTGKLRIFIDGKEKTAINMSGLVHVDEVGINVVSDYCEWIENINVENIKRDVSHYEDMIDKDNDNMAVYKVNLEQNKKILNLL